MDSTCFPVCRSEYEPPLQPIRATGLGARLVIPPQKEILDSSRLQPHQIREIGNNKTPEGGGACPLQRLWWSTYMQCPIICRRINPASPHRLCVRNSGMSKIRPPRSDLAIPNPFTESLACGEEREKKTQSTRTRKLTTYKYAEGISSLLLRWALVRGINCSIRRLTIAKKIIRCGRVKKRTVGLGSRNPRQFAPMIITGFRANVAFAC